jgi:hypothetical protein
MMNKAVRTSDTFIEAHRLNLLENRRLQRNILWREFHIVICGILLGRYI